MPNVGTTRFPRCMARNDAARGGTTPLRNVASLAGHRRQKNRTANVQRDSNNDRFGNLCDSDLNGDLVVNFGDLSMLKAAFFTSDADTDFNSDGIVSFADLEIMNAFFFQPPGPTLRSPCTARSSLAVMSPVTVVRLIFEASAYTGYRVWTVRPHPVPEESRPHACRTSIFRCQGGCRGSRPTPSPIGWAHDGEQ